MSLKLWCCFNYSDYGIADLVETCTYTTAVLFYLEAVAWLKGKQTSTQVSVGYSSYIPEKCGMPACQEHFARKRKRNLDATIDTVYEVQLQQTIYPNRADFNTGTRPVILSLNSESLFIILYSKETASYFSNPE